MNSTERQALDKFISAVRAHYADLLDDILVFGSRARGDARPDSDVDLAIILRGEIDDYWHEKLLLSDLSYDALLDADLIIQSWPVSRNQWDAPETHFNPSFVKRVKRDAVSVGAIA